jgi:transposase
MQNQVNAFGPYSNLQLFVGIDVHKKDWQVCIYSQHKELKNFRQGADPDLLIQHLQGNYPGAQTRCAYEAGFSGFWIQRYLQAHGMECWVIHASDIPVTDKEQCGKTDRIDARKIAKSLRAQLVKPVHVPDVAREQDRLLIRLRKKTTIDLNRRRNRIKGLLHLWGIKTHTGKSSWTKKHKAYLRQIRMKHDSGQVVLDELLDQMEYLEERLRKLDRKILELSQRDPYGTSSALLQSIPGIGVLTSMILLTELGDISRFPSLDHLCSFVGLVPYQRSSGEKSSQKRMTHRSNLMIRTHLIESAWIAISKDPALTLAYERYRKSMGSQKAIVKIARKLINRIRAVLINQTPYQLGKAS